MSAAWLIWVALLGQTAADPADAGPTRARRESPPIEPSRTPTVAPDIDIAPLDDLPLTDEDLALLEALDVPETPPAAPVVWPWAPPTAAGARTVAGARLEETGARSTQAALRAVPALSGGWRWGAESPLVLDGLPIYAPRARAAWLRADPALVDRVELAPDADRARLSEDLGGSLRVERRQARLGADPDVHGGVGLRSADRALYGRADVGWGDERWAVRIATSGQHEDDLRVRRAAGTSTLQERGLRADVALAARAAPVDGLELDARFDYVFEDGAAGLLSHDGHRSLAAGLRARVGTSSLGFTLDGGRAQTQLIGPDAEESLWSARAEGHWRPTRALTLRAGTQLLLEESRDISVRLGTRRRIAGFGFGTLDLGRGVLQAGLRAQHIAVNDGADTRVADGLEALPQLDLHILLVGDPDHTASEIGEGLGFRLHGARGFDIAGPWALDIARAEGVRRSWRLAAGPTLRFAGLWLDTRAVFFTRDDAPRVSLFGAEIDGGAQLAQGLFLAFGAGWAEGATSEDAPAQLDTANLRGHLALRYQVPTRHTFVEVRARASSPRWPLRSAAVPTDEDGAFGFVRLGVAGGLDLGAGFRLLVAVENALDRRDRDLGTSNAAPGLDLRAQLTWSL